MDLANLFSQVVTLVIASGIPVLFANVCKYFFPKLDGKTDVFVNILEVALFVGAVALGYLNPDLLNQLLPIIGEKAQEVVKIGNSILDLMIMLGLAKPIYGLVKNRIPLLGKSFSPKE